MPIGYRPERDGTLVEASASGVLALECLVATQEEIKQEQV